MADRRPILIATDLSARTDRALDRACSLASLWDVPLLVCHVLEAEGPSAETHDLVAAEVAATLPEVAPNTEIIVQEGSAPAVILRLASERDCQLIVTGVARFNQLGDFFIGTAVDRIIREATSAVLVVRQRPRAEYRSILATTDFSTCSRDALVRAATMFPDAAIHVVHAFHVPFEGLLSVEENLEEFRSEAEGEFETFMNDAAIPPSITKRCTTHLVYGETATVVQQVAKEAGTDLLVFGTHGRSGFSKAVFGSVAEALLRCAQIDTLVVREPA